MPWFAFFFLRARLLLPVFAMTLSLVGAPLRVLSVYYERALFYGSAGPPTERGTRDATHVPPPPGQATGRRPTDPEDAVSDPAVTVRLRARRARITSTAFAIPRTSRGLAFVLLRSTDDLI